MKSNVCPICDESEDVVRVLWNAGTMQRAIYEKCRDDSEVVFGGLFQIVGKDAIESACLKCEPRWRDIHAMVCQDSEWQYEKEQAVDEGDMERAAHFKRLQFEVRSKYRPLIDCVTNSE